MCKWRIRGGVVTQWIHKGCFIYIKEALKGPQCRDWTAILRSNLCHTAINMVYPLCNTLCVCISPCTVAVRVLPQSVEQ